MKRIQTVDVARGLVMIIMALDHVRDLIHVDALTQNPTDLSTTTPFLFFTRWVTHLCAPTFVFLSGTSVYFNLKNGKSLKEQKTFLLKRGLWLIFLEFTIVNFGIWFDVHFQTLMFQVIGVIGFGFILLSFLLKLDTGKIAALGLILLVLYPLLVIIPFPDFVKNSIGFLFNPILLPITPHFTFFIGYPPIPWFAVMLIGYGFGYVFMKENSKGLLLKYGSISIVLFVIIRYFNIYGDPSPWTIQKSSIFTFLSFINVTKYPPSPLFIFLMLGIVLVLSSFLEGRKNWFVSVLIVYGKVPLFYYIIHWYIVHLTMFAIVFAKGFKFSDLVFGPFKFGRPEVGGGVTLPFVYLIWLVIVVLMYPLCKWYGNYKALNKDKTWLKYL